MQRCLHWFPSNASLTTTLQSASSFNEQASLNPQLQVSCRLDFVDCKKHRRKQLAKSSVSKTLQLFCKNCRTQTLVSTSCVHVAIDTDLSLSVRNLHFLPSQGGISQLCTLKLNATAYLRRTLIPDRRGAPMDLRMDVG